MIHSMIRYFFDMIGSAVLCVILSVFCDKKNLNRKGCTDFFAKGCKRNFH